MSVFFGYLWRVLMNAILLLVVLYISSRVQGRMETLVMSALGLIYVTVRVGFCLLAQQVSRLALGTSGDFARIGRLLGAEDAAQYDLQLEHAQKLSARADAKIAIDGAFMLLIFAICFYHLLSA